MAVPMVRPCRATSVRIHMVQKMSSVVVAQSIQSVYNVSVLQSQPTTGPLQNVRRTGSCEMVLDRRIPYHRDDGR